MSARLSEVTRQGLGRSPGPPQKAQWPVLSEDILSLVSHRFPNPSHSINQLPAGTSDSFMLNEPVHTVNVF